MINESTEVLQPLLPRQARGKSIGNAQNFFQFVVFFFWIGRTFTGCKNQTIFRGTEWRIFIPTPSLLGSLKKVTTFSNSENILQSSFMQIQARMNTHFFPPCLSPKVTYSTSCSAPCFIFHLTKDLSVFPYVESSLFVYAAAHYCLASCRIDTWQLI